MKRTVVEIVNGFTNEHRWPYAYAKLDCGHGAECALKPSTLVCDRCGVEAASVVWAANEHKCAKCGCGVARYGFMPNAHQDTHQLTKVGDTIECERCDWKAKALAELTVMVAAHALHHTRWRNGTIYCYKRDETSPSGVLLACSVEDCPEAQALLKGSLSPLSPTEGL